MSASAEGDGARPLMALVPRLVCWVVVIVVIAVGEADRTLSLVLVALLGVVTIVSDARFSFERSLDARGLPGREFWVPLAMLGGLLASGLVDADRIAPVAGTYGPILALVLSFALVAEGLRRSGLVGFVAYRLAVSGGGDTNRLMLYLFVLSSVLAYVTSSYVVILVMTPVVVAVAHQANILNAKLLLLSQFVAANTASMGLVTGSPANLLFARSVGLGSFEQMAMMLVPALVALMATFVFVTGVSRLVQRSRVWPDWPRPVRPPVRYRTVRWLVGTWAHTDYYEPHRFNEYRTFTTLMAPWVLVLFVSVALAVVGSGSGRGLLLASLLIAAMSVRRLYLDTRWHDEPPGVRFVGRTLRTLPACIVAFGFTYLLIGDAIAADPVVGDYVAERVARDGSDRSPVESWSSMLAAGALVNTISDLPAAVVTADGLSGADTGYATPFDRILVTQGVVVALNLGACVTPVGALGGIVWFDVLRRERGRRRAAADGDQRSGEVLLPQRRDLVVYGAAMFLMVTVVLGAANFGFVSVADVVSGPVDAETEFGAGAGHLLWTAGALAVVAIVVATFVSIWRRRGVALSHFGLTFVWTALWVSRHRLAVGVTGVAVALGSIATLLYQVEVFHAREYHQRPLFEHVGEFVNWLLVVLLSLESNRFPRSMLGNFLLAAVVLGGVAAVAGGLRYAREPRVGDTSVRDRLARGEIPTDRLIIVNGAWEHREIVWALAGVHGRFVVVVTEDERLVRELESSPHVAVVVSREGSSDLGDELRLHEAREIVLLSRSNSDGFVNLDLLETLDARLPTMLSTGSRYDDGPVVMVQQDGPELVALLDVRLSGELRSAVLRLPFEHVVRGFVVATASGRLDEIHRLYANPYVERTVQDDVDRFISMRGSRLLLKVSHLLPDDAGLPEDHIKVGVQVHVGDRPDWRTMAGAPGGGLGHLVNGTVLLGPDGEGAGEGRPGRDAARLEHRARSAVHVIGGDGLAQRCAVDLIAAGVGQVTLLTAAVDPLFPATTEVGNLTVRRCRDEFDAIDALGAGEVGSDEAILVVAGLTDGFATNKLLEHLSIQRLHRIDKGHPLTPLYVCSRGPEQERRARSFVVDEVIDATWVERSYFAIFTYVQHQVLAAHEDIAEGWSRARQMAVAHRIASRLCHLMVEPAYHSSHLVNPDQWPVVAVIRFSVEHDDDGQLTVAVDLAPPSTATDTAPDDLVARLHCL